MKIFTRSIQAISIYASALLLVISFPLTVMAEEVVDTSQPTTTAPTQVVASTTPLSPSTSQSTPTYTYDSTTGRWNSDKWIYDSTTGTYQAAPQPAVVVQPVTVAPTVTPTVITPQTDSSPVSGQQNSATTTNSTNQTSVLNLINSQAQTGNATVISNTTAKNAASGDATAVATVLNNVNSTLSTGNNQKAASFVTDVMGDVKGDIVLQPMLLKAMLEAESSSPSSTVANVTNNSTLTNDINLNATSGNAGVIGNTSAGNAMSGSANTVANVMNIINSMVAANQSFVGTINIYGNLEGDILIAPDFIPQLIASNSDVATKQNSSPTTTIIDTNNMQSIINNVSLAANSGKAAVMDNTIAGNATSGTANTNVVIFNLSGHEIIASNSLLVFVNVLGKWIGVIVDAPAGATAAALGNGLTTNTTLPPDLTIISNNTSQITNNINLSSLSGNATVVANTLAGNATTGNATASANIANITNDQFGLTGWFGVLFINVFGSWHGSFGIDTKYGNSDIANTESPKSSNLSNSNTQVIRFIPSMASHESSDFTLVSKNNSDNYFVANANQDPKATNVLGSSSSGTNDPIVQSAVKGMNIPLIVGSILITAISFAGIRRFLFIAPYTSQ